MIIVLSIAYFGGLQFFDFIIVWNGIAYFGSLQSLVASQQSTKATKTQTSWHQQE
jgi:hypothetical protein